MTIRFTKTLIVASAMAFGALGAGVNASASGGEGTEIQHLDWGFNGPFGKYDRYAMQRGYKVFREVCSSCHALEHLSFRHLGEKGGPFYDDNYPNPNDNPIVKAFAKDFEVPDIDGDSGDPITRPGIPADKFPLVYPNPIAASASNGGAIPPDLSVITKARSGGADYVYSILTGFEDPPHDFHLSEGMNYNKAFEGHQIKMAQPLFDGQVEYDPVKKVTVGHDGEEHVETIAPPEATVEQMSRDVVEFLEWAGDPKMEVRKKLGFATFLYLFVFALLLFMTYKSIWRNVEH
ncbi:MAG TPA: cytochrome c1 [Hellea balneolensis]|uniref:Cytochrome c1 n=1 Tax=Hellea balneolensis TaxID=287478 RepID=A0A7C5R0D8_9PROT|nr:cytochrome c1 [Hellea balneolensis]